MRPIPVRPSTKIEDILSARTAYIIKRTNKLINDESRKIKTIRDLSAFSEIELLMLKGSGTILSGEMLDAIERAGISPSVRSNRLNHNSWRHIFLSKPTLAKKNLKPLIAI